jgi:hypothetical protein
MRRTRLCIFLFALALALQALAPVVGNLAVAGTIDLGGVSFSVCQSEKSDGSKAPLSLAHHQTCALCQVYCDGIPPVAAGDFPARPQYAQWRGVPRSPLDRVLPTTIIDYARRARAPPAFS